MEQVRGIEPPCSAWEADILPLNYTCIIVCIIPYLPPLFNPVESPDFNIFILCTFYNFPLAFFPFPGYTKVVNRERRCCGIMMHNFMPAQDIDDLIFGTSEIVVSER